MAKEIEPRLQTIGVYLKKNEKFRIPEYQRAYSWDLTNCDKLWQDIDDYIGQGADDPYFFGTIIIDGSKEGTLNLIDGQQRTTTFLLLLKAMHISIIEALQRIPDNQSTVGLKRSLQQSLDYIYEILYRADVRKQIEIEGDWSKAQRIIILENESINELHKDEFQKIMDAQTFAAAESAVYKTPRKQKDNKYTNFFRNFKSFYLRLSSLGDSSILDQFVNGFLNKCQIIEIKSWQVEQAITMFNSLNSTGLPLSDADIISARLFSKAPDSEKFRNCWSPIITAAEMLGSKKIVSIDGVLQQFMYINRALNRQYNEGELATPGVRKYYTVLYPTLLDNPYDLCANFKRILDIWERVQDYPIIKLLMKFNENFKLFLISYLYRIDIADISENAITPLAECLLRLFAILEAGNVGYSSKKFKTFLFNENFRLVDKNVPLSDICEDFNNHISKTWTEEDVKKDLLEYDKNVLVYLNEYLYAKEHNLPFDFNSDKVNIEHIMPSSGHNISVIRQDAGVNDVEFNEIVNSLGNKILLEEDINKTISNDWFITKKGSTIIEKTGYRGSNFGIATALSHYPSDRWTKDDIEKATDKAASRILRFIFNGIQMPI